MKEEAKGLGVQLEKNADRVLARVDPRARGGFDYILGIVYLRKGATQYEAFHEMAHARQWADLGKDAYIDLGKYAREQHVFREVFKNRKLFSREELNHAIDYLRELRDDFRLGDID